MISKKVIIILCISIALTYEVFAIRPDTIAGRNIEYEYAYSEATKQFILGNYRQALNLYMKCLEYNSSSATCYYQLGNIYMMAGDSKKALDYSREAWKKDSKNKWIIMLFAKAFQLNDKEDSALILFKQLTTEYNDNLEYKFEYANMLGTIGKYYEALKIFNTIEYKIGINESTSLARHQIFMQLKQYDRAAEELRNLIEIFPDEIRYLGMLAEMYSSLKKNDKAKELYEKIFRKDSTNTLALISVADFYRITKKYEKSFNSIYKVIPDKSASVESKVGLIMGYLQNDSDLLYNKEKLIRAIKMLINLNRDNSRLNNLLVDFYIKTSQYDSAIVNLEPKMGVESNAAIWEQYYFLLNAGKKYDRAIEMLDKAITNAEQVPGIYLIGGLSFMQKGKYKEAKDILIKGLNNSKADIRQKEQLQEFLGESCFKLNDYICSDSCFENVLKINPFNLIILNNYSYYLGIRNINLKKAMKMSRIVIRKESKNATYLDTYAFILMKEGKYKEALKYIKRAIKYDIKEDADILEHMGDIYYFLKEQSKAMEYWKMSIKKGNKEIDINQKLKMK